MADGQNKPTGKNEICLIEAYLKYFSNEVE
jgi:hypothetical protein